MERLSFTLAGALAGARRMLPIAPSSLAWGIVFGVLARQAGLSLVESLIMSGSVFAGGAQLIAMELWRTPLPALEIVITTLVVNLRLILMGASLYPWFSRLPARQAYGAVNLLSDESWALTLQELETGRQDGAFLVGAGLTLWVTWVTATLIGQTVGAVIGDPARWGLDFVSTAVFTALLVGMWKGKSSVLPWLVAAVVAIVASRLLPGKWYILLGGLAGSLVGAWRSGD